MLIGRLHREPDRFAELAARHPARPSKEAGGSLGQVCRCDVAPEIAAAITSYASTAAPRQPSCPLKPCTSARRQSQRDGLV
jgi:hypothetical protein